MGITLITLGRGKPAGDPGGQGKGSTRTGGIFKIFNKKKKKLTTGSIQTPISSPEKGLRASPVSGVNSLVPRLGQIWEGSKEGAAEARISDTWAIYPWRPWFFTILTTSTNCLCALGGPGRREWAQLGSGWAHLGSRFFRTRLTKVSTSVLVMCFSRSLRLLCRRAVMVSSARMS